jgi:cation transport regulator ChaC
MSESVRFFGFGSLIFAPEFPADCEAQIPAILHGYRRDFNKRSRARSCPISLSYNAFPSMSPPFRVEDLHYSLALGTLEDPTGEMQGVILQYPAYVAERVLRSTDLREGYDVLRDDVENGYLRRKMILSTPQGELDAWVYLSNLDPRCTYFVSQKVDVFEKARILINATPAAGESIPGHSDVRGLYYLEGVRKGLKERGIVDGALEEIAQVVLSLEGPWCDWVQAPEKGLVA